MFPVVLNLKGKRIVVFGGGNVAERRVAKLVKAGAKIKVVSEGFTAKLKKMGLEGKLQLVKIHLDRNQVKQHLVSADLVLAATNNKNLNDGIESESRALGKWVNRADGRTDFSIPATLELGGISIAISTAGRSPGAAKRIKDRIKKAIAEEDLYQIELQEFARGRLKKYVPKQKDRERILKEMLNSPELLQLLKKGEIKRAKSELMEMCDAYNKH